MNDDFTSNEDSAAAETDPFAEALASLDAASAADGDLAAALTAPSAPVERSQDEDSGYEDSAHQDAALPPESVDDEIVFGGDEDLVDVVEEAPAPKRAESPFDRPGRWYVVHTYAGYENKVKQNLASRVRSMAVEEKIFEVVIPMEDVIEFKGGAKRVVQKKLYPGYLYIRIDLDDDSWYVVRNTPGVTGFVGSGARPVPLSRREVEEILGVAVEHDGVAVPEKKMRPRLAYDTGEQVRVVNGPFADFNGIISDIDIDRSKLKVLVNIFGRETPVELEFGDVAKL